MGKLLLAQAPPSYPRNQEKFFPWELSLGTNPGASRSLRGREARTSTIGGGGSHFISSAIKTYQRRIIKSRDIFQICMLNELTLPA